MSEHFAGRSNCTCAVCRPHLVGIESEVMPSDTQPNPRAQISANPVQLEPASVATPVAPPKKRPEPPAHYLKKREPWDGYVGMNADEGQSNDWHRFDNKIIGRD